MTTPLDVLVDASQLTGQSSASGIGSYVRTLLEGLSCCDDIAPRVLATATADVPDGIRTRSIRRHFSGGRPAVWEHELRRSVELRTTRAAVFHNPNPHAPISTPHPWVQTLYDVIPLVYPDPTAAGLARRFRRFGPRYARADAVVAISRHAADDGIAHLGIDPARLHVIYPAVDPCFTPTPVPTLAAASGGGAPSPSPDGADRTGGERPYLLMVCEYSRRKGLAEALEVIAAVADAGFPHTLRIAGRVPPWTRREFDGLLAAAPRPDRVEVLGFVDDLRTLYRGADVQVVTSRYEGFGYPAAEAMACGTPVVAFDGTSLPEVVGPGGLVVPDGDLAAFATAVTSILASPARRDELAAAAVDRSARFSRDRGARAHAELYRSLVS